MSDTWLAGVILITLIFVIIGIPCVFVAVLGFKMLNKLAYFPSKNPAIQTNIFIWLVMIEIVAFTMLMIFYHVFSDYSSAQ